MSTLFGVVGSLILFVGGMWLFGAAFDAPGYESVVFILGILAISVAVFIPTTIIGRHTNTWKEK